jgi:hypothetical protein
MDMGLRLNESRLKTKMLEHQIKVQEYEQAEKERGQKQLQADTDAFVASITKPTPAQPAMETEPGDVDIGALQQFPGQPGAPKPTREMSPQEIYTAAAMRRDKFFAPTAADRGANRLYITSPGSTALDATGKEIYRNPTERTGVGVESQMLAIHKKIELGTATQAEINVYNSWPGRVKDISTARGEGAKQGGLNVEQSPAYQRNITQKEESKAAGQPIPAEQADKLVGNRKARDSLGIIRNNLDSSFLGVVKGTDTAYEARRRAGSIINSPVSAREATFRSELSNLQNVALYDQSGKQINEAEAKRIKAVLPKATDEYDVFMAGLKRFEAEVERLGGYREETVTTPRGRSGQVGQGGPQGNKPPPGAKVRDYTTLK